MPPAERHKLARSDGEVTGQISDPDRFDGDGSAITPPPSCLVMRSAAGRPRSRHVGGRATINPRLGVPLMSFRALRAPPRDATPVELSGQQTDEA
jgi:hypothetical protein